MGFFSKKPEAESTQPPRNPNNTVAFRILAIGYITYLCVNIVKLYIAGGPDAPSLTALILGMSLPVTPLQIRSASIRTQSTPASVSSRAQSSPAIPPPTISTWVFNSCSGLGNRGSSPSFRQMDSIIFHHLGSVWSIRARFKHCIFFPVFHNLYRVMNVETTTLENIPFLDPSG